MSRDIPIIFSGPMVRALLEGRKTMTRRLAWHEGWYCACDGRRVGSKKFNASGIRVCAKCGASGGLIFKAGPTPWQKVQPGDRLYVRENWAPGHAEYKDIVIYQADGIRGAWMYDGDGVRFLNRTGFVNGLANPDLRGNWIGPPKKWRPCIHMPRKYSRLTLEVTAAKIEKLHAIAEADAIAEGIEYEMSTTSGRFYRNYVMEPGECPHPPYGSFSSLWRSLHGDDGWDSNPEVVALSFKVHHSNIGGRPKAT